MFDEEDHGKLASLQHYISILPSCTLYEDRLFFINGIILLEEYFFQKYGGTNIFDKDYRLYAMMKRREGYTYPQIRELCCVSKGPYSPKEQKMITVGCMYGR